MYISIFLVRGLPDGRTHGMLKGDGKESYIWLFQSMP